MLTLTIKDMSCGHCVGQINRAITALDPNAVVTADIPNHKISVKSELPKQDILDALEEIGYPATTEASVASCCNAEMSCKSAKMAD